MTKPKKLKRLGLKLETNLNNIFIEDFIKLIEYAQRKGWKDINAVTHEIFILGIVCKLVNKENRKGFINELHSLKGELEYKNEYGVLKITKAKYKENITKPSQYSFFTNNKNVSDSFQKTQFYKMELFLD